MSRPGMSSRPVEDLAPPPQGPAPGAAVACPCCGSYGGSGATLAQAPALLAVCDVLVVRALEAVGKQIVRSVRSRHRILDTRPMYAAHTIWRPEEPMVVRGLKGAWDVIPALLDHHGCCGVTSRQVSEMVDAYVRDLLITGTHHNLSDLRYRFETYLGVPLAEPEPYTP